jgi:predicted enzyme related to lactoylglutathione lyase
MQLRGTMLYVKDLERMKRFYADMLGTEPGNENRADVWAAFDAGAARFYLHAIPAALAMDIEIDTPPVMREDCPVKLIFEVKDVEGERERLESLGVQTIRRPWQVRGESCDAVDPEGNVFQICSSGLRL